MRISDWSSDVCSSDLAAVVATPDPLYGAVATAFVRLSQPVAEIALRAHARAPLANYKVPKRFLFLDELPRLPIGKLDKRALLALVGQAGVRRGRGGCWDSPEAWGPGPRPTPPNTTTNQEERR